MGIQRARGVEMGDGGGGHGGAEGTGMGITGGGNSGGTKGWRWGRGIRGARGDWDGDTGAQRTAARQAQGDWDGDMGAHTGDGGKGGHPETGMRTWGQEGVGMGTGMGLGGGDGGTPQAGGVAKGEGRGQREGAGLDRAQREEWAGKRVWEGPCAGRALAWPGRSEPRVAGGETPVPVLVPVPVPLPVPVSAAPFRLRCSETIRLLPIGCRFPRDRKRLLAIGCRTSGRAAL